MFPLARPPGRNPRRMDASLGRTRRPSYKILARCARPTNQDTSTASRPQPNRAVPSQSIQDLLADSTVLQTCSHKCQCVTGCRGNGAFYAKPTNRRQPNAGVREWGVRFDLPRRTWSCSALTSRNGGKMRDLAIASHKPGEGKHHDRGYGVYATHFCSLGPRQKLAWARFVILAARRSAQSLSPPSDPASVER
jgi:hypothetical protein